MVCKVCEVFSNGFGHCRSREDVVKPYSVSLELVKAKVFRCSKYERQFYRFLKRRCCAHEVVL